MRLVEEGCEEARSGFVRPGSDQKTQVSLGTTIEATQSSRLFSAEPEASLNADRAIEATLHSRRKSERPRWIIPTDRLAAAKTGPPYQPLRAFDSRLILFHTKSGQISLTRQQRSLKFGMGWRLAKRITTNDGYCNVHEKYRILGFVCEREPLF